MSLIIILSIALQAGLIAHVIKTGRSMLWIFAIFFLPLAGPIAYVAVEILPGLFGGRTARRAEGLLEACDRLADAVGGDSGNRPHRVGAMASHERQDRGRQGATVEDARHNTNPMPDRTVRVSRNGPRAPPTQFAE